MKRRVVGDGDCYLISCALREDGKASPASDLLDHLAEGMWDDPNVDELPDEYQPNLRRRLIAHIEHLAEHGYLQHSAFNRLDDGIWELKVEGIRVSFYDTDGAGEYEPKYGEPIDTWDQRRRYELPEFDEYLRLGHSFAKIGQRTTNEDLDECAKVRDEDVNHDKLA